MGVAHWWRLRGRPLSSSWTCSRRCAERTERLVPLGKYWRIRSLDAPMFVKQRRWRRGVGPRSRSSGRGVWRQKLSPEQRDQSSKPTTSPLSDTPRWHESGRTPRAPTRLRLGLSQPDQQHRQITPRERRLQTPTTPWIVKSPRTPNPCAHHLRNSGQRSRSKYQLAAPPIAPGPAQPGSQEWSTMPMSREGD